MRNRINALPADAPAGYRERLGILRERKLEETRDKKRVVEYVNGDDHGSIAPPEDFTLEPYANHANGSFYGYDGWSKMTERLLEAHPVYIDPVMAFPNRWMIKIGVSAWQKNGEFNPDYSYDHLKHLQRKYAIVHGIGAKQHFGGDYSVGLRLGWGGLLNKLEYYRMENPGRDDFYDAEARVIRGIQQWMRNTVYEIDRAIAQERHPAYIENLKTMRENTEYLVEGAPKTMRQACEWMCWFNMVSREYNGDGAGGQLDELLRPYYEADLAAGAITEDEAKYYIACLLLNDPQYYQVGGLSADGEDMVTYMSYMILEAADWLDSSCNITVRVHEGMDMEFLRTSVKYLFKNKNGWPRFSGDTALSEGFMRRGYPRELAVQRIAVGCHWMSLPGLEYTMNDCVKTNNARVFEVAFDEMMTDGGELSTARLWELYKKHSRASVEATAEGQRFHLKYQEFNHPELLLNLISHGPVEKGRDMACGGADYYNICIDGTGIGTVADSFAALEQRVEREGRLTYEQVYDAMKTNFDMPGGRQIRLMLQASNRYGGGNTRGDYWAQCISENFTRDVVDMDGGGLKFIPGWFSWSNTIALGKVVGATPNGRLAGDPISHGANPNPGFRKDGALTAMSNSICSIQPGYGNTAPIQLELDPGIAGDEEGVGKIVDYIRTISQKGSTLLNINIINADQILEANDDPSLYPDLVVRVTGFTAYFCMLSPDFRKLVVDRILLAN